MKTVRNAGESIGLLLDRKVESRFDGATIERGLRALAQAGLVVRPNPLTRMQARYKLRAVARYAANGQLTVIEHKGAKFVLIPADKLFDIAERLRQEARTPTAATQ